MTFGESKGGFTQHKGLFALASHTSLHTLMKQLRPTEPEPVFLIVPRLMFHQALCVTHVTLNVPDDGGRRNARFLLCARSAYLPAPAGFIPERPDGTTLQVEVIAYPCSDEGVVFDWEKRFEGGGTNSQAAIESLCAQITNGIALLRNYEGLLEKHEAALAAFEAADFADWDGTIPQE